MITKNHTVTFRANEGTMRQLELIQAYLKGKGSRYSYSRHKASRVDAIQEAINFFVDEHKLTEIKKV